MSRIPANVSDLKVKLKKKFDSPPVPEKDKDKTPDPNPSRRTTSEIHKEREKRRALLAELNDVKTSEARKQEIIDGLQAQLETAQSELEEHKAKVEELTPKAKAWSNFEHKERTKLLDGFPPEKKAAAKKIIESMDIDTAREYAQSLTGKGATDPAKKTEGKEGKIDWEKLSTDPVAFDKAVKENPAEFTEYMETVK